jgi:hypothetical protein
MPKTRGPLHLLAMMGMVGAHLTNTSMQVLLVKVLTLPPQTTIDNMLTY